MPRFQGYPANWDLMSALEKIEWVKGAFPGVTNEAPKMVGHIVNAGGSDGALRQVASKLPRVSTINGQTGAEIYAQSLLDKQKAAQSASAGAAGVGAGLKGLAGLKMGAAASFGAPLAAGALGAMAIRHTKKKFDKEIDTNTRDTMKRGDELIAAARRSREKKNNTTNIK